MKKVLAIILCLFLLVLAGCQVPNGTNSTNKTNDTKSVLLDLNYTKGNATNTSATTDKTTTKVNTTTEVKPTTKPSTDSSLKDLPVKRFKEGDLVKFKKGLAYDPDGKSLQYQYSLPLNKDGEWQTVIGDAGEYIISVTASDGKLESTQKVKVIIEAVNKAPVITNFNDITVSEGETIKLNPTTTDADEDKLTLKYTGFMTSSEYKTTYTDAGNKKVVLTVSDGKTETTKEISITIENKNRAPTLDSIKDITVVEGQTAKVEASAKDPDSDALTIKYGEPLNTNGTWTTKVGDAGTYEIDVTASDGKAQDKQTFKVTVTPLNNVPVLTVPEKISVKEGDLIDIKATATDKDAGDTVKITYSGFMTTAKYQTTYDDAGEYKVTVSATDGKDTVSKNIDVQINDSNRPPVFSGDLFE